MLLLIMIIVVILLIIVSVGVLLSCQIILQSLRFKLPPGPRPWPVIGNFQGLKPVLFRCYNEWSDKYGPIISVWYGPNLNVVVSNCELAKQVLKDHDQKLANRYRTRVQEKYNGAGQDLLWADYGPHFVRVRKMCALELFNSKKIEALRFVREEEVFAMIQSIYNDCTTTTGEKLEKSFELRKHLRGVTLNNMTRLVLGKKYANSNGELDEQGREFKAIVLDRVKLQRSTMMVEHMPWLQWILQSKDIEFEKIKVRKDQLTKQIMDEHTKARLENSDTNPHFLDALLSLKDDYSLTDDNIIGLLWNMIIAGMDTVAVAVEWAMAELLKNPRVVKKAQEELDRVIGTERIMSEDDIPTLTYLQAIVKEALRLHPPVPLMLPHRAKTHVKIGGYDIPQETTVYVNVWAIGRDSKTWPNPTHFRPERFLETDIDVKGSDFRVLPFGAGRRVCIGNQLALKLVTIMLGRLLHQFNWCPPQGVEPEDIDLLENESIIISHMATPIRACATPRLAQSLFTQHSSA